MPLDLNRSADESPVMTDTANDGDTITADADEPPFGAHRADTETASDSSISADSAAPGRPRRIPWRPSIGQKRPLFWKRILAYGVLPLLALALAGGAGYLKWLDTSAQLSLDAAAQPIQAATEGTVAMLAYQPDTAEKDLTAAADRLTGPFREEYTTLIRDLIIPGAKDRNITAVASVPSAALVSATANRAVVLVFVNQTTTIDDDAPTNSASSALVTLDKLDDRWLISQFEPV